MNIPINYYLEIKRYTARSKGKNRAEMSMKKYKEVGVGHHALLVFT